MTYIHFADSGILLYKLINRRIAESVYLIAFCGVIGCTTDLVKKQQPLDFSNVGRIELQLDGVDSTASSDEIGQQVVKNLAEWGYPLGAKDNQPFSHTLKATVGKIEHGDTPTGFSFSSGNSDPRALDFQKADVLPISCQLAAITHPEQSGELNMELMASEKDKQALVSNKQADHISTVCFNLLRELKWSEPLKTDGLESIKPSWMPEIRIETKEIPVNPANKVMPDNAKDTLEVEEKETATTDVKKQIIIHNQGSPVIFQFGHERR
jgi:hypothetical protein